MKKGHITTVKGEVTLVHYLCVLLILIPAYTPAGMSLPEPC